MRALPTPPAPLGCETVDQHAAKTLIAPLPHQPKRFFFTTLQPRFVFGPAAANQDVIVRQTSVSVTGPNPPGPNASFRGICCILPLGRLLADFIIRQSYACMRMRMQPGDNPALSIVQDVISVEGCRRCMYISGCHRIVGKLLGDVAAIQMLFQKSGTLLRVRTHDGDIRRPMCRSLTGTWQLPILSSG
jgi:hypothetical protein